jgi:hypothetical protein
VLSIAFHSRHVHHLNKGWSYSASSTKLSSVRPGDGGDDDNYNDDSGGGIVETMTTPMVGRSGADTCNNNYDNLQPPNRRAIILNQKLERIIQSQGATIEVMNAALRPMQDPMVGYDQRFGRSALRAYQAFVFPKSTSTSAKRQDVLSSTNVRGTESNNKTIRNCDLDDDNSDLSEITMIQLEAAAGRCARQIEFLIKRHQSHQTEWIRHHDDATVATLSFSSSSNNNNNKTITVAKVANSDHDYNDSSKQTTSQRLFPIVLVLDNLRSALNVGSLYRTAETCACQAVLTCGITPHPHGNGAEKIRKSALGSE